MDLDIVELLGQTVVRGASDLHLCAGSVPMVRMHGDLSPIATTSSTPSRAAS